MRTFEHPSREAITLDAVLSALSDPLRRKILRQLSDGPAEQYCSQFDLTVAKSTQTHHFRALREAGLIRQRYQGTAILNSIRDDDIDEYIPRVLDAVLFAERRVNP